MQSNPTPIHLINASAGSGKTYTLVEEYLSVVLGDPTPRKFRSLLALTFTNKAVYEMKFRILEYLDAFTRSDAGEAKSMFVALKTRLNLSDKELKMRAKRVLASILKDYGAFDVITLDRFTHRIIRGFAKDLGLSFDFEVQLDVDSMLSQVVDRILLKVGQDSSLTQKLEAFTFQKMDADLSWDIKKELIKTARLLLDENDRIPLAVLRGYSPKDFDRQNHFLNSKKKNCVDEITSRAKKIIDQMHAQGLSAADFSKTTKLYDRFYSLAEGDIKGTITSAFEKNIALGEKIYTKALAEDKKESIETLLPQVQITLEQIKECIAELDLIEAILKYWIPQALIQELSKELESFQQEENQLLLGTFNAMISQEILQHDNLRIYERLGETYRHFFIDEFQDTSSLQWENLVPLLKNPMESLDDKGEEGSLLIVGDPKQSIYRWRGGNVRQFIRLLAGENPFLVPYRKKELEKNFRSRDQIVLFNNALYAHLAKEASYDLTQNLFSADAEQQTNNKPGGWVNIQLLPPDLKKEETTPLYAQYTLNAIKESVEDQYALGDIAVLVRTNEQANHITRLLAAEKIDFVSSDGLRYGESKAVNFLMALMVCAINPKAKEYKFTVLCYLYEAMGPENIDLHGFVSENLNRSFIEIFSSLSIVYDLNTFHNEGIYESFEKAYYAFEFSMKSDAFVESFLEGVFEFSQTIQNDPFSFLEYWQERLSQKSIALSDTPDSVKVMTIHKSKGLGFPVVIFPFAEQLFQPNQRPMLWLDTKEQFGKEYTQAWIPFSEKIKSFGESGYSRDHLHKSENEMDTANLLYVTTTRAKDRLYIVSKTVTKPEASLAGLLNRFTASFDSDDFGGYTWGEREINQKAPSDLSLSSCTRSVKRYPWEKRLVGINGEEDVFSARTTGIKMHDLLAQINSKKDIDSVIEVAVNKGSLKADENEMYTTYLHSIVNHTDLAVLFAEHSKGYNEQEIVYQNRIHRPDRFVVFPDYCVVLDYKTGKKKENHKVQLQLYASALHEIYQRPIKQFLVYLKEKEIELISL